MSFTGPSQWARYNGTGLVQNFTSGHRLGEISVIYNPSRDVYQMWGSRVYYSEAEKPALYPGYSSVITGVRIGYAESTDGINFTFIGDAIPSTYDGSNITTDTNYGRAVVRIGLDGNYHMLIGPFGHSPASGLVTQFDYYRSPTGLQGSWTLIKAGALTGATFGNAGDIIWDGGIVKMFYEGYSGGTWNVNYASGSDLEHMSLYGSNPILSNGRGLSDPCIVKAGNKWVMVTHETVPGSTNTPSQGYYYTANSLGPTGWISKGLLLDLVNFSNAPGSPAQAADFFILEAKGQTNLYWTEQSDQSGIQSTLYFAYASIDQTLAQLFDPSGTTTTQTPTSTSTTQAPSTTTTQAPEILPTSTIVFSGFSIVGTSTSTAAPTSTSTSTTTAAPLPRTVKFSKNGTLLEFAQTPNGALRIKTSAGIVTLNLTGTGALKIKTSAGIKALA